MRVLLEIGLLIFLCSAAVSLWDELGWVWLIPIVIVLAAIISS